VLAYALTKGTRFLLDLTRPDPPPLPSSPLPSPPLDATRLDSTQLDSTAEIIHSRLTFLLHSLSLPQPLMTLPQSQFLTSSPVMIARP
jgi:hypothetical protein